MTGDAVQTVTVQSPYVIIDAAFDLDVAQASERDTITVVKPQQTADIRGSLRAACAVLPRASAG